MKDLDLLKFIDYTTLNFLDDRESVSLFIDDALNFVHLPAAICLESVYSELLVDKLIDSNIQSCVVACAFPNGKMDRQLKLEEINRLVQVGVDEIDIVLPYDAQKNSVIYIDELMKIKALMPETTLKVIIESGLLNDVEITQACHICILGGVDFIKTSTGKNRVGATLNAVRIISEQIKIHFDKTGIEIGIKISGGVKDANNAFEYMQIVRDILGKDWLTPSRFRIGASSLIKNILNEGN